MKRAGLKASSQKKISEEVVGVVGKSSVKNPEGAAVVYLQAPAKDLDRLYLGLIADRVGVKSLGMSLATECSRDASDQRSATRPNSSTS